MKTKFWQVSVLHLLAAITFFALWFGAIKNASDEVARLVDAIVVIACVGCVSWLAAGDSYRKPFAIGFLGAVAVSYLMPESAQLAEYATTTLYLTGLHDPMKAGTSGEHVHAMQEVAESAISLSLGYVSGLAASFIRRLHHVQT